MVRSGGKKFRAPITSLAPLDEFFNSEPTDDSTGERVVDKPEDEGHVTG